MSPTADQTLAYHARDGERRSVHSSPDPLPFPTLDPRQWAMLELWLEYHYPNRQDPVVVSALNGLTQAEQRLVNSARREVAEKILLERDKVNR